MFVNSWVQAVALKPLPNKERLSESKAFCAPAKPALTLSEIKMKQFLFQNIDAFD